MDRKYLSNAGAAPQAGGAIVRGWPQGGDGPQGTIPTSPGPQFFEWLTESLMNVVNAASITPDASQTTQVYEAIVDIASPCVDGPAWETITMPATPTYWAGVCYDPVSGHWIAGYTVNATYGIEHFAVWTADPKNWTNAPIQVSAPYGLTGNGLYQVCTCNGVTIMSAASSDDFYYSSDGGVTWTIYPASGYFTLGTTPQNMAACSVTGRIYFPNSGSAVSTVDLCYFDVATKTFGLVVLPSNQPWNLCTSDGVSRIMAITAGGGASAYSDDGGLTWSLGAGVPVVVNKFAFGNGIWLGIPSESSLQYYCYSEDNGATWTTKYQDFPEVSGLIYAQGVFLIVVSPGWTPPYYSYYGTWAFTLRDPAVQRYIADPTHYLPGLGSYTFYPLLANNGSDYVCLGFGAYNFAFYGKC